MNKVFDIVIDEDGIFNVNEFNNVEEFNDKLGFIVGRVFSSEFNYDIEKDIVVESVEDMFEYDGGEVEYNKFKEYVEKINEFVSNNNDYIIVSYSVEYDVSFLVIKKVDFDNLVELV